MVAVIVVVAELYVAVTPSAAPTYGPTKGPPPPTGSAPAGLTESVDVSATVRSRFKRPLPVCPWVPAASAFRARRDTMTPFAAPEVALTSAAAPATSAADADVPVTAP